MPAFFLMPSVLLRGDSCVRIFRVDHRGALHSEALSLTIDVAQAQVDVCADALHRLYGERAAQVLSVGPGGGQAEAKPAEHKDTVSKSDAWLKKMRICCRDNTKLIGNEV